jgi:hypothetical protein
MLRLRPRDEFHVSAYSITCAVDPALTGAQLSVGDNCTVLLNYGELSEVIASLQRVQQQLAERLQAKVPVRTLPLAVKE